VAGQGARRRMDAAEEASEEGRCLVKLPGKLSISRRTSNVEPDYFVIEIEDVASGIDAVSLRISPADLALALSGRHGVPIDVEWHVENVGMRAEIKTEIVRCKGDATETQARNAVYPFEVDGWVADMSDVGNPYKRSGDGYRVTFRRWVKP
jgi:hypothetical protein